MLAVCAADVEPVGRFLVQLNVEGLSPGKSSDFINVPSELLVQAAVNAGICFDSPSKQAVVEQVRPVL